VSYLDLDAASDEGIETFRQEVHAFASERLRPIGREIDRMDRDRYLDVADRDSPYWDALAGIKGELGAHRLAIPQEFGGEGMTGREFHVLMEELAWGSPGLAIAFGVDLLPAILASMSFDEAVRESFLEPYLADDEARFQGCWGVTEPAHGSEHVQAGTLLAEGAGEDADVPPPEVTTRREGDRVVIDGAKSRWVSAGPMATHCALHVDMDPAGGSPGSLVLVDLDREGVHRGPPIDKLGQRDCPQGELVFDAVEIPEERVIMGPDALHPDTGLVPMTQILCLTSAGLAAVATGLARAAFEEALAFAREREQGGKPIADHQSVRSQLYEMFEAVETCRAYSRRVTEHVWDRQLRAFEFDASHHHAVSAQVYCKRTAFQVAHRAVQVHGARGITTDYLVEKLFRDARVKLIEDGTVEVLGLEAADGVLKNYET